MGTTLIFRRLIFKHDMISLRSSIWNENYKIHKNIRLYTYIYIYLSYRYYANENVCTLFVLYCKDNNYSTRLSYLTYYRFYILHRIYYTLWYDDWDVFQVISNLYNGNLIRRVTRYLIHSVSHYHSIRNLCQTLYYISIRFWKMSNQTRLRKRLICLYRLYRTFFYSKKII